MDDPLKIIVRELWLIRLLGESALREYVFSTCQYEADKKKVLSEMEYVI